MAWLTNLFTREPVSVPEQLRPCWDGLNALKQADRRRKIFGAEKHKYQSVPIKESDLAAFESWCGLTLPITYREHLLRIGAGAGPYYGLWKPAEIRSELEALLADWDSELGPKPNISKSFPYTLSDAEKIKARQLAGEKETFLISAWPVNGCIPICHQGCTFYSALVVSGEYAGRVWNVANYVGSEGQWLPSWRPTGYAAGKKMDSLPPLPLLPTFEEWFMGWIEQAMADLVK